jgi:hypothetical protein
MPLHILLRDKVLPYLDRKYLNLQKEFKDYPALPNP